MRPFLVLFFACWRCPKFFFEVSSLPFESPFYSLKSVLNTRLMKLTSLNLRSTLFFLIYWRTFYLIMCAFAWFLGCLERNVLLRSHLWTAVSVRLILRKRFLCLKVFIIHLTLHDLCSLFGRLTHRSVLYYIAVAHKVGLFERRLWLVVAERWLYCVWLAHFLVMMDCSIPVELRSLQH